MILANLNIFIFPMSSTKLQLNPTYGLRDEFMKKIKMAAIENIQIES